MMAHVDPLTKSFVLTTGSDLEAVSNPTLESIFLRLATEKGTCFWDLDFGSDLHTLRQAKVGADATRNAEDLVTTALQPMVDAGELLDLEVAATLVTPTRIDLFFRALDAGKRPMQFTYFVRLG